MGQVYKISSTDVISHYTEDRKPPMESRRSKIPSQMSRIVAWHARHNARGKLRTVNLDVYCTTINGRVEKETTHLRFLEMLPLTRSGFAMTQLPVP